MQVNNLVDLFNEKEIKAIKSKNISLQKIQHQYKNCLFGTKSAKLSRVATVNDGIFYFSDSSKKEFVELFNSKQNNYEIEKFVPASGAASRMFKFLQEFLKLYNCEKDSINAYINKYQASDLNTFLIGLEKFSFYEQVLNECIKNNSDFENLNQDVKYYLFIKTMLDNQSFNMANMPKALIPFHKINNNLVTPIQKHVKESIAYASNNGLSKIHFTVTKGHQKHFEEVINNLNLDIKSSFSFQSDATDSIAFDLGNEPFRTSEGNLLFRPGGHGALIENLNLLNSDIVFIKNIDNVSFNHFDTIVNNKKFIGGLLIKLQERIFSILNELPENNSIIDLETILLFMEEELSITIPKQIKELKDITETKRFIELKLNRPIRVCGMVKNEGEPGGGPFWVENSEGEISLQIVESSQIDTTDLSQKLISSQATHFNPVDIVCGLKNHKGKKFDLQNYVDPNTGFVVYKSHEGRDLKSYELPGLWNGAMANWITVFVEVPIETFNPVKTVNDLLKPAHQHA